MPTNTPPHSTDAAIQGGLEAARAYFERGFLACYAWTVTKRDGEALSDATIDHAWDNREEGGALPSLAASPPHPIGHGEREDGPYVAGPVWHDEDGECWTAEIQIIGGHYVVATVHGGSRDEAADRQAAILTALTPTGSAEPEIPADDVRQLVDDEADPYTFWGDADEDGRVVSQHRYFRWGDDCIIAVGELNSPNIWNDEAFEQRCNVLVAALSHPTTPAAEEAGEVERLKEVLSRLEMAAGAVQEVSGGTEQHAALWHWQLEARAALASGEPRT